MTQKKKTEVLRKLYATETVYKYEVCGYSIFLFTM